MAKEQLTSKLSALVPEIYYDLIARVPVGIVLAAVLTFFLATPLSVLSPIERLSWPTGTILLALLLIVSNSVGLIITPFGELFYNLFAPSIWNRVQREHPELYEKVHHFGLEFPRKASRDEILRFTSQFGDLLMAFDNQAGQVTTKMRAEVAFCNNLAAGLLVTDLFLFLLSLSKGHTMDQLRTLCAMLLASGFVVLAGWSVQLQFLRRRVSMLLLLKQTKA